MTTVWIEDIAEAFENMSMEWKPYVNKTSGMVVYIPLKEELLEECSDEERELYNTADFSNYLSLPEQKELREYDIMEEYAQETVNTGIRKRLLSALNMSRPFRNFRSQIRLLNLEEDYNHYRFMIYCAKARKWCLENEIEYNVEDEEVIEYLKQIEEDEKFEKELEDFDDSLDEFEYEDDYEDYFE